MAAAALMAAATSGRAALPPATVAASAAAQTAAQTVPTAVAGRAAQATRDETVAAAPVATQAVAQAAASPSSGRRSEAWRVLAARWDGVKAAMTAPMEKVSLPLEYFPDGRVKARLSAERAQVFDGGGTVFAEGVRIELLAADGGREGELRAEDCLVDRKGKQGFCRGAVRAARGGDLVKGRGLYFSFAGEYFRMLSHCEVRTARIRPRPGRRMGGRE